MRAEWVAFDTETTGVEPGSRLVELGAVAFAADGTTVATFSSLVHPGMPMPPDATAVSGLSERMLASAPPAAEVLREFLAWLPSQARLVAHNAQFDQDILGWELDRAGLAWPSQRVVDSCLLARVLGETANNRLQTIIAHHGWEVAGEGHRALPDADAVRRLLLHALGRGLDRSLFTGQPFTSTARYPRRLPRNLAVLPEAIATGKRIATVYTDRGGVTTEREVTPLGYAQRKDVLQWHGWCHLREQRRTFLAEGTVRTSLAVAS